jgi:NitT/TauT family transport system substrate-binding protein
MTKKVSRRVVAGGLAGAAAGLAVAGMAPRRSRAAEARKVTFLMDVTPYGKHALFYPAIEMGYFRDLGLDVTFQAGKGSADVAVKIAAGAAEAGFADAATTILARGKGAKIKEVLMVHYKATNCAVTDTRKPARLPKDLMGLKLGATAGDAPRVALPALAEINKFDAGKVEIVTMESSAKPAMFMSNQVDGLLTLTVYTPVLAGVAKRVGREVVEMRFSDFGLDIYSNGVIVSDTMLEKEPDIVRNINQALVESFIYAVENPEKALDMFSKHNPAFNKDIARAQLAVAIDHLMVPEVKKNGVGPMSADKMAFTLDIVRKYYGMEGQVQLDDVYTNAFVKAGQLPKV